MTQPTTPGEARKQSLRRTRWVVAGVTVGAATFLTGIVAGANGSAPNDGPRITSTDAGAANVSPFGDQYRSYGGDDRYADDNRFDDDRDSWSAPQQSWSPSQSGSQPQTRSGGS